MKIKSIHKLKMPNQHKIKGVNWILNRFVKVVENKLIRKQKIVSCIKPHSMQKEVIISMTTYPARIEKVVWTIKSLLNQEENVDRIILWLAEEQYSGKITPKELREFEQYGLEIRFCDDIKSHKKYYYTMKENPDAIVITVDDDVIYPEDTVKKLLNMHTKYPNAVICNQARMIIMENDKLLPYSKWTVNISQSYKEPDFKILPIGEGGILYPPQSLDREVFNKQNLLSLAVSADDLWLKFMALKSGTKSMVTEPKQRGLCEVQTKNGENSALNIQNINGGRNDKVINELMLTYPEINKYLMGN